MKTFPTPAALFATLYACLLGYLAWSANDMPQRAPTHFDVAGEPDGWMNRSTYLLFTAVFGLVFPLVIVGICYAPRRLPASLINIPHREHWLAAERRTETF